MTEIKIEASPSFADLQVKFSKGEQKISDYSNLWTLIHQDFGLVEKLMFSTKGAFGGMVWAPLKKRYAAQKRKRFPGRGLLVRTGKTKSFLEAGAKAVKSKNTMEIKVSSSDFPMYQNRHQRFEREVFDFNAAVGDRWGKITGQWLQSEVLNIGL